MSYGCFGLPIEAGNASDGIIARRLAYVQPGDILLVYPTSLSPGQLVTHFYQNYRGYRYFDNLCTHACIILDAHSAIDATPAAGVSVRAIPDVIDGRIYRVRRIARFTARQRSEFVQAAQSKIGAGYDWLGLLGGASGLANTASRIKIAIDRIRGSQSANAQSEEETTADALHSFYCSQLVEYCYTKVARKTFSDQKIAEIFAPGALSATTDLDDILLASIPSTS